MNRCKWWIGFWRCVLTHGHDGEHSVWPATMSGRP